MGNGLFVASRRDGTLGPTKKSKYPNSASLLQTHGNHQPTGKPPSRQANNNSASVVPPENHHDHSSPLSYLQVSNRPLNGSRMSTGPSVSIEAILGSEGSGAKYIKRRTIGKGSFGEAHIVERNPLYDCVKYPLAETQLGGNIPSYPTRPGGLYVAKVMDLRLISTQDRQNSYAEIACLTHTCHFAIIRYYEHYVLEDGEDTLIIITEFADHGDLRGNLTCHRHSTIDGEADVAALHLTEKEAGTYFVQLLLALQHIHKNRMIHRDVKSANIFLTSHGIIKLGDFGFSKKFETTISGETVAETFLGTPYYLSPEMWEGKRYGKKADIWAAGIILYEMLMDGARPFSAGSLTELRESLIHQKVELPETSLSPVRPKGNDHVGSAPGEVGRERSSSLSTKRGPFSLEMRELVRSIFAKNPHERPDAEQLLHTPIMQYYLFVLERHVKSLIEADARAFAANPNCLDSLVFRDASERELVLKNLEEAKQIIEVVVQRGLQDGDSLRYEGVVYKRNNDGSWKERYLILTEDFLIISLSRSKEAADGTDRSRKVPLKLMKSVSRCAVTDFLSKSPEAGDGAKTVQPAYAFTLVMMESTQPIFFGVQKEEELYHWINCLIKALKID